VCPFAGYLQDLFGKRYIALFGALCICIGCVLVGSGHSFAQLLAGMALSGAGAAIGELTGLAGYLHLPNLTHIAMIDFIQTGGGRTCEVPWLLSCSRYVDQTCKTSCSS